MSQRQWSPCRLFCKVCSSTSAALYRFALWFVPVFSIRFQKSSLAFSVVPHPLMTFYIIKMQTLHASYYATRSSKKQAEDPNCEEEDLSVILGFDLLCFPDRFCLRRTMKCALLLVQCSEILSVMSLFIVSVLII